MEAGIDEAGRGPVLGPLVVAGVATDDPEALWRLGCKDSKLLSPSVRGRLARLIRDQPGVTAHVVRLEAAELDARMATMTLNDVEADLFSEVARALGTPHVTVDAADADAERFGRRIAAALPAGTRVVSEHKADARHATVAAASILAKTTRDEAIADLGRRLERKLPMPLGSGYPSDPTTVAFLKAWMARHGDLPEGTRRRWKTVRRLQAEAATTRLGDFESAV